MAKQKPLFYGWVVVGIGGITQAVARGVMNSAGVFFVALLEAFGWSRAVTVGAISVHTAVSGAAAPAVGLLADRAGPRLVISLGGIVVAAGLGLCSLIQTPWHFHLAYGLVAAVGIAAIESVPHTALISRWFIRRRGAALGLAFAGSGLGIVLLVPLMQSLITAIGWRNAYLILAGIVFVLVVPLTAFFQRDRPQEMGLWPDNAPPPHQTANPGTAADGLPGEAEGRLPSRRAPVLPSPPPPTPARAAQPPAEAHAAATTAPATPAAEGVRSWTFRDALHSRRFWLLFLSRILATTGVNMLTVHQVAYMVDVGFSKMTAASAFGVVGLLSAPGRLTFGALSDRTGRRQAYALNIAISVAGAVALLFAAPGRAWLLAFYVALYGLGYGGRATLYSAMTADLFPGQRVGAIFGLSNVSVGVGGAFGSWLGGYIHDRTGSYLLPFLMVVCGLTLSGITLWIIYPRPVRRHRSLDEPGGLN